MQPSSCAPHHHAVKFYPNDASLFACVAGFLGQGLIGGQPGLVIATAEHTEGILAELRSRNIDVERAVACGELIVLDAHHTLDRFMVHDQPDGGRFAATVGRLIEAAVVGRREKTLVRAYGEMVDVLWKGGQQDAAIRLEILWNQLAAVYGFALLCGYAMGSFYKETQRFEEVCRQHSHVVPPDAVTVTAPVSDPIA